MMRRLFFLVSSIIAISCFAQDALYGENFLQSLPLPTGEWEAYKHKQGTGFIWLEKNNTEKVEVKVLKRSAVTPDEFKLYDENLGKTHCAAFESEVISNAPANGYDSRFWKTVCTHKDNSVSTTFYKAIKGSDAFYLIKKLWLSAPTKESLSIWSIYLDSVSVCDTRASDHPCPSMEKPK